MKSRKDIVENWLPRYTGRPLGKFGKYILLTNFQKYVKLFAEWHKVPVMGEDKPMPSATAGQITIINFGMGSATAATVMDLLSAISPEAVLFLGKCGGIKQRSTQPTGASGSTTRPSRSTSSASASWPSTWRPPPSS